MVFCSSAGVAEICFLTPPTSVETSAILALAVLAADFTSLISLLTCCWTLASSDCIWRANWSACACASALAWLESERAWSRACARAASRSAFMVSKWRSCDAVVTEDASRRLLNSVDSDSRTFETSSRKWSTRTFGPLYQFPLGGVRPKFVEAGDFRLHPQRLAAKAHLGPFLHQLAPERVLRLKTGDQNRIPRIFDVVAQVVQNAPLFAHPRGRNHHKRTVKIIQFLGIDGLANILQPLESKRVLAVGEVLARFLVEALGVIPMHLRHVERQRAVHEERDVGNPLLIE